MRSRRALSDAAQRTLVFVAGASPQIVTETVWCLLGDAVPTRIVLLTTTIGRDAIARELLGRHGSWRGLRAAYSGARHFRLARRDVVVLRDGRGRPLADVRSRADSAAAADQIAAFVARHTADGMPPLHASIAGGRKTMGYLLAAAMMLYGRPGDRLSHVLVWPSTLEGTDFFFPPRRRPRVLVHRRPDGKRVRAAGSDVRIELADLPFPRLRAIHELHRLRDEPFSRLVQALQDDLDALVRPRIEVDLGAGVVRCAGRAIKLSPNRCAIYAALAERRRAGCGDPACAGCPRCFLPAGEIPGWFADRLREGHRRSEGWGVDPRRWDARNFRSDVSKINAALRRSLRGASGAYAVSATGRRGGRLYGLTVPAAAIAAG